MRSCVDQGQHEHTIILQVKQQPIRLNMAFPDTFEIPRQFVITMLCIKRLNYLQSSRSSLAEEYLFALGFLARLLASSMAAIVESENSR